MSELSNEQKRKIVVDELWLQYFNDTLLKHGLITPQMHAKMKIEITLRTQRLIQAAKTSGRKKPAQKGHPTGKQSGVLGTVFT